MDLEASVVTSPDMEDSDWVPLQNPFSLNASRREEEGFSFTVGRGTSDAHLLIAFSGEVGGGEECELEREISFDKLQALHRSMIIPAREHPLYKLLKVQPCHNRRWY